MQKLSSLTTSQIRTQVRTFRRELSNQQRIQEQQVIYQKIAQHPAVSAANNIAIFVSFDGELETKPIIEYLWQQQKSVFIPIIHPFNKKYLLFVRYQATTQLTRNKFGILQPKLNIADVIPHHKLDVIFTPLVAFDERNYRIGMGGGYYDRMLADYQKHNIYPIGLAFNCQKIPHITNQPWDVQLPEIITG